MINKPGIYDIPSEEYHSDPCETPSLSVGMINDLLLAPAKCREKSRRLNPNWEAPKDQDRFTIGTVAHVMFLEPHLFDDRVVIVNYDDWRKDAAKAIRDDAKERGKTAILRKHMDTIHAARAAFMANSFVRNAFEDGQFERSMFWRHPRHGFWCRARPDFLSNRRTHLNDYKATKNADPQEFGRHADNLKYYRRAAWYLEGAEILFGKRPDHYWFVNQETASPFLPSVVELDMQSIEAGQAENDEASAIFAKCLSTNDWYGYRDPEHLDADRAFRVGLPTYAFMKIDARLGRSNKAWPAREAPQRDDEDEDSE